MRDIMQMHFVAFSNQIKWTAVDL